MVDHLSDDYAPAELARAAEDLATKAFVMREGTRRLTLALRQPGLRSAPIWESREIACGHDVMLDQPAALVEALLSVTTPRCQPPRL